MARGRNKRELNAARRGAVDAIKMYKADIKEELREYKKLSRIVKSTYDAYEKTRIAVSKRSSSRSNKRNARAEESYRFARLEYDRVRGRLDTSLGFLEREYAKLMDTYRSRGNIKAAERAHKEYDEYHESVLTVMEKYASSELCLPTGSDSDFLHEPEPKELATVSESRQEAAPEPESRQTPPIRPSAVSSTVTSVTVAPVTIDVTPIVERAIDSFIERLDVGLSRRIDEYTKGLSLPDVTEKVIVEAVPVTRPGALERGAVAELSSELLSEEEHIISKLQGMCTSISSMLEELTALSSTYHDISLKCRELAELQRTVNDMQRHTAREQKGVQVNQKLVADEQAEIIAAETLVVESQRELAEHQSAVATLQREAEALGAENVTAMESIIARERELSAKRAELAASGDKLADATEQAILRQEELHREQKETLSRTKKLLREQKQLAEKAVTPTKKKTVRKTDASQAPKTDEENTDTGSQSETVPSEE
ncbi:MAG: hypothetical protein IJW48_00660 [Clostridia bacterium]|nr:hypothetical protein [Clostridia bacterium]